MNPALAWRGTTVGWLPAVIAGRIAMQQFATMLTAALATGNGRGDAHGRLVMDKTGLTGRFAFTLTWTP